MGQNDTSKFLVDEGKNAELYDPSDVEFINNFMSKLAVKEEVMYEGTWRGTVMPGSGKVRLFVTRCHLPSVQPEFSFFGSFFYDSCELRQILNITTEDGLWDRTRKTYNRFMGVEPKINLEHDHGLRSAIFVKGLFWEGDYRQIEDDFYYEVNFSEHNGTFIGFYRNSVDGEILYPHPPP